jgi:hypothetical protein
MRIMLSFIPQADPALVSGGKPFIHRSFVKLPATATAGDVMLMAQHTLHAHLEQRNAYRGELPSSSAVQITAVWTRAGRTWELFFEVVGADVATRLPGPVACTAAPSFKARKFKARNSSACS